MNQAHHLHLTDGEVGAWGAKMRCLCLHLESVAEQGTGPACLDLTWSISVSLQGWAVRETPAYDSTLL